jgi:hypothetical protein
MTKKIRGKGRPAKYTKAEKEVIRAAFTKYIEGTELPIIKEFALKQGVNRVWLYGQEDFATLIDACQDKKEVELEKGALTGKYKEKTANFSLMQLGWRSNQDSNLSGSVKIELGKDLDDFAG